MSELSRAEDIERLRVDHSDLRMRMQQQIKALNMRATIVLITRVNMTSCTEIKVALHAVLNTLAIPISNSVTKSLPRRLDRVHDTTVTCAQAEAETTLPMAVEYK